MKNAFYFGDNLHILREYIPDESVDLIYLDPPFNSNANYNLLFRSPDKSRWSDAQIATFEDTWSWGEAAEETLQYLEMTQGPPGVAIASLKRMLGQNNMLAYLTMMTARLIELHRVLRPTGTLYLHCDPTASHYLKLILDSIFSARNYRSEIVWKRTSAHANATKNFAAVHDILFRYTRSDKFVFNGAFADYSEEYIAEHFVHSDPDGRLFRRSDLRNPSKRPNLHYIYRASDGRDYEPHPNGWAVSQEVMKQLDEEGRLFFPKKEGGRLRKKIFLDEAKGVPVSDVWDDLPPIHASSAERLGYPTQKPIGLMERIIDASTQKGDVVLDPFCGCGTTLHAAQSMGRHWVGIDVAVQAMRVVQDRLIHEFKGIRFDVFGIPQSADAARFLAAKHPFKFEEWAVAAVGGMHSGKFRGDAGIDGSFYWLVGKDEKSRGIISVKGGKSLNPAMIRDLVGTLQREREETDDPQSIGIFICAHKPSKGMYDEARMAGYVETFIGRIPAIQVLTVEDLFAGNTIKVPAIYDTISAAAAGRARGKSAGQFIDPAEVLRQRHMLFSFEGGGGQKRVEVMPEQLKRAG